MNLKALLRWSEREFQTLPWRNDRSLYRTLVSEIMLQQTTVGTVKNHFERFLKEFPDLPSLARASESELLVAWKGLGYYRRARSLKKIAEAIARDHMGIFPSDPEALLEIPGIGPYTSQALVAIGMNERGLAVDANLERVIARLYGLKQPKGPKLQKEISLLFQEGKIFPKEKSYRALNEALMDLGRTFCQARKASCELCPLKESCVAFTTGQPLAYPADGKEKKKAQDHELTLLRAYVIRSGKLLVYEKMDGEWLSGQFEVPTFIVRSTDKNLSQYPAFRGKALTRCVTLKTGITRYKISNHLYEASKEEVLGWGFTRKLIWKDLRRSDSNLSTATLKGLRALGHID